MEKSFDTLPTYEILSNIELAAKKVRELYNSQYDSIPSAEKLKFVELKIQELKRLNEPFGETQSGIGDMRLGVLEDTFKSSIFRKEIDLTTYHNLFPNLINRCQKFYGLLDGSTASFMSAGKGTLCDFKVLNERPPLPTTNTTRRYLEGWNLGYELTLLVADVLGVHYRPGFEDDLLNYLKKATYEENLYKYIKGFNHNVKTGVYKLKYIKHLK